MRNTLAHHGPGVAATSNTLVKYDEMCRAINAAYEVDEVKDIRDKAAALVKGDL